MRKRAAYGVGIPIMYQGSWSVSYLHSICLSHDPTFTLSERMELNLAVFRHTYPDHDHNLYGIEEGREFIRNHFETAVVDAFDRLVPLAYKADLLRYCLLYVRGGIYSDIGISHFFPIPEHEKNTLYVFRDAHSAAHGLFQPR